jgi:hypothetical protein
LYKLPRRIKVHPIEDIGFQEFGVEELPSGASRSPHIDRLTRFYIKSSPVHYTLDSMAGYDIFSLMKRNKCPKLRCPYCQCNDIASGVASKVSLARARLNEDRFVTHVMKKHLITRKVAKNLFRMLTA